MKMAKIRQPEIDWLKAVILERMSVSDFSYADMATLSGIGVNRFGKIMKQPVPTWPYEDRKRVLRALQIRISELPGEVQQKIAQFEEV